MMQYWLKQCGQCHRQLMRILPWSAWLLIGTWAADSLEGSAPDLSQVPLETKLPGSDGSCALSSAECRPSEVTEAPDVVTAPPVAPPPPPLPPAPAPPPIEAPSPIQAPSPIRAPSPIQAPSPPIQAPSPVQAPGFPVPLAEQAAKPIDSESYGFNDREAWLSIGQRTESEAEKQMRLAMADEVKMEARHFAEVLEHQKQSIHHDAWAYYEGDLMRMKHYKLIGLKSSLIVMCFSPLFARVDTTASEDVSGGGCRAAWLGEDWVTNTSGQAVEDGVRPPKVLPPLPWGQSFPFLEQASVGNHLELARMGNDRFLVCFETTPSMQVSCRMGLVANNSAVITYGALLEDSPARLVSVSPGRGSQFAVCSQSLSENSRVSCRWGETMTSTGTEGTELQWTTAAPLSFAFDDRK